jgi:hypothetical protein
MAQHKTKQKIKSKEAVSQPPMLSEERIIDSDSDSPEEQEVVLKKPTSKQNTPGKKSVEQIPVSTNGKKRQVSESRSSSDRGSANNEADETQDEVSEEGSDSQNGASPPSGSKRSALPTHAAPAHKKSKPTPPNAIAPKVFKAPKGFERTTLSASDYADSSTEFLTKNLTQKQVWHITAPASLNISKIKPFDIQDVRSGKPIVSKNGVDYGFLTGLHKMEKLLLPSGDSVQYTQSVTPITGTYHLREMGRSQTKIVADGDKENSEMPFAARAAVASKSPREQPVGLRMRYQPYGSSSSSKSHVPSSSPPTFRMAPELPDSQLDKSARKKARKERRASQQANQASQDIDAMDLDHLPSSTIKNPDSGKPSDSATTMVDKVFEAVADTPSQEKKRKKKKKYLITEEADL